MASEAERLYKRRYRATHPQQMKARQTRYYTKHRTEILARARKRYANDPKYREAILVRTRQFAKDHKGDRWAHGRRGIVGSLEWRVYQNRMLKQKYGIGLGEYEFMEDQQHGCCALCGFKPDSGHRGYGQRRLNVDHDKVTGRVRGLLCSSCNRSLGQLGDTSDRLKRVIEYLEGKLFMVDV